ncbi:5-methyltetrahydropteroyltriglutamate--homocysteine S-methyltransferase [Salirhabdus sp. Marseille-P4669]|uniref:5-methyltetrahydropteroyltriglutamate-- homocysteine S-methyltransferase n=1 Tax=Salirhabdus sp. Marseille-P4669 TaxID=2042310 RepID=UPI000C79DF41|nr:5-methyltetrahydropteroyltriglutamate--homocysteine S-methyltransferase [Salirhabdus sp. Marseille-P4669]
MTKTLVKAPFKADHVGSLLRPESLQQAREEFKAGKISLEELRRVQTREIKRIVEKQVEIGLEAVTDGEFRRSWWHIDFIENLNGFEGFVPERGIQFAGLETEPYDVRNVGKISFNQDHPFVQDFIEFKEIVGDRAVPKQTIPSPNQLFHAGIRNPEVYPNLKDYVNDVIQAYRDALKAFYDAGCRYLQFDDVYIAGLNAEDLFAYEKLSREELIDLALHVVNSVLEDKPEDLVITTHLCRGNYRSTWAFEGSYAHIAPTLFAKEKVDGFFLEYDDDRSGDFKPLRFIPNDDGPQVVLGLFTSKFGELEDKALIKARVEEATQFVPKEKICLSPQCGFASTHHGNKLTEEQQWDKLKYIVDLSKELLSE